jgi:hypothetical protein
MPLGSPPPSTGLTNPMTNTGDLIIGGSSGTPQRLAAGANKTLLASDGAAPAYSAAPTVSGLLTAEGGFSPASNGIGYKLLGTTTTVAAGGTLTLTTTTPFGLIIVFNSSDGHGRLVWSAAGASVFDIGPSATSFVVGSDTGTSIAVFASAGALVIKNRTAGNQVLTAHWIG